MSVCCCYDGCDGIVLGCVIRWRVVVTVSDCDYECDGSGHVIGRVVIL